MKNKRFSLLLVGILIFAGACSKTPPKDPDTHTQASMNRFRVGELKEYQGKILSPSVGPRDNSISGVQKVDIKSYQLKISGLVSKPTTLTYDEVLKLNKIQRLYTIYCTEGWNARILWEGVLLEDLIKLASPNVEANTVIFHAVDGYTTSLSYDVIKNAQLLMAFNANGIELPPEMGYPFIVVAQDKWGYKWARWVNEIELTNDPAYKGYWESRGYSVSGELSK